MQSEERKNEISSREIAFARPLNKEVRKQSESRKEEEKASLSSLKVED